MVYQVVAMALSHEDASNADFSSSVYLRIPLRCCYEVPSVQHSISSSSITSCSPFCIRGGHDMSEEAIFEHTAEVEQTHMVESQMVHDNEQFKKDFSKFGLNVNGKLVVKLVLASGSLQNYSKS